MCEDCGWQGWLEQSASVLDLLDELPEAAEEFEESVREKVDGMVEWVEAKEHVTEKMANALDNMEEGAGKWTR